MDTTKQQGGDDSPGRNTGRYIPGLIGDRSNTATSDWRDKLPKRVPFSTESVPVSNITETSGWRLELPSRVPSSTESVPVSKSTETVGLQAAESQLFTYETADAKDMERNMPANVGVPRRQSDGNQQETTAPSSQTSPAPTVQKGKRNYMSRKPVASGNSGESGLTSSFTSYRETATADSPDDVSDSESVASIDSLEMQLGEFRKSEAKKYMDNEDWETAKDTVLQIIDSLSPNQKDETAEWHETLAEILLAQGLYKEAEEAIVLISVAKMSPRCHRLAAEAAFGLGDLAAAKLSCATAIKHSRKKSDPSLVEETHHAMYLMSEIMDAMGKKVDASFYRSRLGRDYVPKKPQRNTPAPDQKPKESGDTLAVVLMEPSPSFDVFVPPEKPTNLMERWNLEYSRRPPIDRASIHFTRNSDDRLGALDEALRKPLEPDNRHFIELVMQDPDMINIKTADRKAEYALHIAARRNHPELITALLDNGANIEALDEARSTPLIKAAYSSVGNCAAARVLLERGANVDARDDLGNTALHCAASYRCMDMVKLLLAHNANTQLVNGAEYTPVNTAVSNGFLEIAAVIEQAVIDQSAVKESGSQASNKGEIFTRLDKKELPRRLAIEPKRKKGFSLR